MSDDDELVSLVRVVLTNGASVLCKFDGSPSAALQQAARLCKQSRDTGHNMRLETDEGASVWVWGDTVSAVCPPETLATVSEESGR